MPELPDIDVYVDVLASKLAGHTLEAVRLGSPFVLRSVEPPLDAAHDQPVETIRRIGKRVAIGLANDVWLVIHLMVAGRLHWHAAPPALAAKNRIAAFDFDHGSLLLTEAGSKKRASLTVVASDDGLGAVDPGGIEPLTCSYEEFRDALTRANHTLKRALTDPRILSGIGNAYSDEILHAARLSPVALSQKLEPSDLSRLYDATREVLERWRERLRAEAGGDMPASVTAFRDGMKVHGRYREPCLDCGEPVQRIRYKSNETNYCAACQTGGRILKDRSLSRILKDDWPKTLDEL